MKWLAAGLLGTLLALAGCAGQPNLPANYYLLRTDAVNRPHGNSEPALIILGNIDMAGYVDQPGLVLENADGTLHTARNHRWAEPVRESLRIFLANEMAAEMNQPVGALRHTQPCPEAAACRAVKVHIEELHGTKNGESKLLAYWALMDLSSRELLAEHEYKASEPLDRDGYDALVAAHTRLLAGFARDMARKISGTINPPQANSGLP